MKQKTGVIVLMILFAAMVASMPVSAKTYEENGFSYQVSKKQAVVTGVKNVGDHLVIPDTLGGFKVTKISTQALAKQGMTKVTLPAAVETIEYEAFRDCKKLKEITLPARLEELGGRAFYGCTALTTVSFNNRLRFIENRAFSNCIKLKKVVLSKSVTSIGKRVFEKCYKLSSVKLNKNLKNIDNEAFYKDYALKSITIPAKVQELGDRVFSNCEDLVRVKFANPKTKLGNGVFYKCLSLKKAVLPKKINHIPESTFSGCRSISSVTIPKRVSIIKKKAFYECKALKSVKLNKKVYAIGDSAFAYSALKKLKLNSKMQFIGNGAFRETKLQSLKLPSRVTFIGNRVFANCRKLRTIYIPASVKGVNPGAFQNCVSLRAIHVAAGNKNYASTDGVLYDKGRKKLIQYPLHKTNASFRTPGSLQKIRKDAFSENPYLKHVTISARTIGHGAFSYMPALRSVTILNGTTKIEASAFYDDDLLSKITLPDSVSYIGSYAFGKTAVSRIRIPSRLTRLGDGVFDGCDSMTAFEGGNGSHYKVQDGVLYNGSKTHLIKYPSRKKGSSFVVPDSVQTIRNLAFESTNKLTKIEFGKGLRNLWSYAINDAKNLKSVVFQSKRLDYGSSNAIYDCDKLAVIVGPDTYTFRSIARNAKATLISL